MITLDQYLNQWKVHYGQVQVPDEELTDDMRKDAQITVDRANQLLARFGQGRDITSGWRPIEVNKLVPGAAQFSNHTKCCAVDISDPHGDLDQWCLDHPAILEDIGLWLEHPSSTKGWCHVQIVAPRSGKRVFFP